jgi:hypothetical protein
MTVAAELALDTSAVLDVRTATTAETLLSFEARDLAELTASIVDNVVTGTIFPPGSVVPVIVVSTGPFGLSEVITAVVITGRENEDTVDGKAVVVVSDERTLELPEAGGTVGTGIGGKPSKVVLTPTGDHARPPGPTAITVGMPSIFVVTLLALMSVVYWLSVIGVYDISIVLEPSNAVSVMTKGGVGIGVIELGRPVVKLGKIDVGVGPGIGPFVVVMAVVDRIELDERVIEDAPGRNVIVTLSIVKVIGLV